MVTEEQPSYNVLDMSWRARGTQKTVPIAILALANVLQGGTVLGQRPLWGGTATEWNIWLRPLLIVRLRARAQRRRRGGLHAVLPSLLPSTPTTNSFLPPLPVSNHLNQSLLDARCSGGSHHCCRDRWPCSQNH